MANITRIKASDPSKPKEPKEPKETPKVKKVAIEPKKDTKTKKELKKELKKEAKLAKKAKKASKKPFILFRPFVALGHYLKNSWIELRQVRWPNRKTTWKMVLAVFVYTLIFVGLLLLLDIIFDLIFNKLIG